MRKRKIKFEDLVDLVSYYDFYRFAPKDTNGVKGMFYKTDKLNPEAKAKLESYNNVRVYNGHCEYAPEIRFYAVFVGDKCFK